MPPAVAPRAVGALPVAASVDAMDRLAHARGQGLPDIVALRGGLVAALPDAVCRPASAAEVEAVLHHCARDGIRVVPWGGGTSVTGGVNVLFGDAPVVTLDLERLSGLARIDPTSGLAAFGAGTSGPEIERALGSHGLTLGHFPQSWELSTVGGWVATRSAGQQSLGYGRIEAMTAGLELVAPAGRLSLPALPASAAGPDLRQVVLGSEGRLGVITEVTVRARPRPEATTVEGALLPSFDAGVELLRVLMRAEVPLDLLRLSDPSETRATFASMQAAPAVERLMRLYFSMRGIGAGGCLLIYGASGTLAGTRAAIGEARAMLRAHRAVLLGRRPGRQWVRDRFRRPYLREALLDRGYATDTVETAVPWSRVGAAWRAIGAAISGALWRALARALRANGTLSTLERRWLGGDMGEAAGAPLEVATLQRLRISNLVLIREASLELAPGLNAITGETGAGKTILTNAIGLLLGARGDAALIGAAADEAYVEAEFADADDETLGPLAELRPEGEDGVVLARRIFTNGRTRAYAWGRSAAREDVAGAAEALIAMSGQFEQRRLSRPGYQRETLDSFAASTDVQRVQPGATCRRPGGHMRL